MIRKARVTGNVMSAKGAPLNNHNVVAYSFDDGSSGTKIGEAKTNAKGEYVIDYKLQDRNASTDIQVKVFATSLARKEVAASPLILNARAVESINLSVGKGLFKSRSEFEVISNTLNDLAPGTIIKNISDAKIALLTKYNGLEPIAIETYIRASVDAGISKISIEALYGLYRGGVLTQVNLAAIQDKEALKNVLKNAIARNLIPKRSDRKNSNDINALQKFTIKEVLRTSVEDLKLDQTLFNLAGLSGTEKEKVVADIVSVNGDAEKFWKKARNTLSANKAKKLQDITALDVLALNHTPLTEALVNKPEIKHPRELVAWNKAAWERLFRESRMEIPDFIEGKRQIEKRANYAIVMQRVIEDAFPSEKLSHDWSGDLTLDSQVGKFLTKHTSFSFENNNINTFFSENSNVFTGIANTARSKDTLSHNLRSLQNLYHITPRFEKFSAIKPLWEAGLTSSHQIKSMGAKKFAEKYAESLGGVERANFTYANAQKVSKQSLLTLFKYGHDQNSAMPASIPKTQMSTQNNANANPTLENIFGSLDYCQCKHCRSVLSPAAYLVDLLLFLKDTNVDMQDNGGSNSGLEELFKRRPDIGNIELSCDNTNTVIPHIDLVNEILEDAVKPRDYEKNTPEGTSTTIYEAVVPQTVDTRPDIQQAMAEHLNTEAYEELRKPINLYPWSSPYNLWQDEAQSYLHQLGVSRHDLMKVLRKDDTVSPKDADIAAVQLGISVNEKTIITSTAGDDDALSKRWGLENWHDLKTVPTLLLQAGLTYEELQEILSFRSIAQLGDKRVKVEFSIDKPCALEEATLKPETGTTIPFQWFDLLQRFLRLSRRVGLGFRELDQVLMSSGVPTINNDFLVFLGNVKTLANKLNISVTKTSEFFQSQLNTHRYHGEVRSRYEEVFLSSGIGALTEEIRDVFTLNIGFDEISDTNKLLTDEQFSPLILSAAEMDLRALNALIERDLSGNAAMNLASLSHVYRVGQFCYQTKVSVTDYLSLKRGLNLLPITSPVTQADPATSLVFFKVYKTLENAELEIAEINYIAFHETDVPGANALDDEEISRLLDTLATAVSESNSQKDPSVDALEPTYAALLRVISEELEVPITVSDVMLNKITNPANHAQSVAELLLIEGPAEVDKNHQKAALVRLHKSAMLLKSLPSEADQLLLMGSSQILGWLDLDSLPVITPTNAAERTLAAGIFEKIIHLIRAYQQLGRIFLPEHSLSTMMAVAMDTNITKTNVSKHLAIATGWPVNDINTLVTRFDITRADMKEVTWLQRLELVFKLLANLGSGVNITLDWAGVDIDFPQATQIRALVKSKYSEKQWLDIAPDLRDPIRERQRDALLGHVLHNGLPKDPSQPKTDANSVSFKNEDELFLHLLIDTQIKSCLDTSRIKQATLSVQLFVQQILLGIDGGDLEFSAVDAKQWQWRKNYRVWEANRNVFLQPENWIYPELRDDKSVFFEEMEEELAQVDLNKDTAKDVYLNYLNKLNSVAQLEISGIYEHYDDVLEKTLHHVFARTRAHPHTYYYRRWVNKTYWTPWERVALDIEGNHLIPTVYRGRLFLFWPKFLEKSMELTEGDIEVKGSANTHKPALPKQYYEVQMSWSEYKNNQWGEMQLSIDSIDTVVGSPSAIPKEEFYFYTYESVKKLVVAFIRFDSSNTFDGSFQITSPQQNLDADVFVYNDLSNSLDVFPLYPVYYQRQMLAKISNGDNQYMAFRKIKETGHLELLTSLDLNPGNLQDNNNVSVRTYPEFTRSNLLENATSNFKLMLPHQFENYLSQSPLFYSDDKRTFFIIPRDISTFGINILPVHKLDVGRAFLTRVDSSPPPSEEIPSGPLPRPIRDVGDSFLGLISEAGGLRFNEIDGPVFGGNLLAESVIDRNSELGSISTSSSARIPSLVGRSSVLLASRTAAEINPLKSNKLAYKVDTQYLDRPASTLYSDRLWNGFESDTTIVKKKVKSYRFMTFYHPFVPMMIQQLNREGIDGLLKPQHSNSPQSDASKLLRQNHEIIDEFESTYAPTKAVEKSYPIEEFDFSFTGAYSHYNWELFFHAPLLVAERLMQNRQFEEARNWLHYIFDPTEKDDSEPAPKRFWKIKPFFEYEGDYSIQKFIERLNNGDPELEAQLAALEENPFNPHLLARMRYVAYMKKVVMTYIDNLIAWGDHLYRRDTMESVNEAAQLYVMAAQILGRRPEQVEKELAQKQTFNQILPKLDDFGNAIVNLEADIASSTNAVGTGGSEITDDPSIDTILYFCVPNNDKLLGYWDTVGERLFNIRHCMNIEGVRRALKLFEPKIDPNDMIRAAASGLPFNRIMDSIDVARPHYRFVFMIQKANEFCADVKALGSALLQALEKQDAEAVALLRAGQQMALLAAIRDVKLKNVEDAKQNIEVISARRDIVQIRRDYYAARLAGDSVLSDIDIPGLSIPALAINDAELIGLGLSASSIVFQTGGAAANVIAGVMNAIPNFQAGGSGACGSPYVTAAVGGPTLGKVAETVAQGQNAIAGILSSSAQLANTIGGFMRRGEEWGLQRDLANAEHDQQLEQENIGAEIRLAGAQKDLESHDLQAIHAESEAELLESKFTNKQLYTWMTNQLSQLYFTSYEMAHQLAKAAEKCYQHELSDTDSNFIQFGYWDGMKKGLLAGERLQKDLRRLEMSYLEKNARGPELNKSISLITLNPAALLKLKQTGKCDFVLPEVIFDIDHPGHYMRRIKNLSLSIPCVVGPNTNVSTRLTLVANRIRKNKNINPVGSNYAFIGPDDDRFDQGAVPVSIATSNAQNDSGMFEVNFRDERYLPFEGAGVISHWSLELPTEFHQFDYNSISDVVIQLQYTALDGGDSFKTKAATAIGNSLNWVKDNLAETDTNIERSFSAKYEFGNDWYRFLNPVSASDEQKLTIAIKREYFPYLFSGREMKVQSVQIVLLLAKAEDYAGSNLPASIKIVGSTISPTPSFSPSNNFESQPSVLIDKKFDIDPDSDAAIEIALKEIDIANLNANLIITVDGKSRLNPDVIEDCVFIVNYSVGKELG